MTSATADTCAWLSCWATPHNAINIFTDCCFLYGWVPIELHEWLDPCRTVAKRAHVEYLFDVRAWVDTLDSSVLHTVKQPRQSPNIEIRSVFCDRVDRFYKGWEHSGSLKGVERIHAVNDWIMPPLQWSSIAFAATSSTLPQTPSPYRPKGSKKSYKLESYCMQNVPPMSRRDSPPHATRPTFSPSTVVLAPACNYGKRSGRKLLLKTVLANAATASTWGGRDRRLKAMVPKVL